jgi:hypothetical protein
MKFLFIVVLVLLGQTTFAQLKTIEAKDAYKYVNQIVTVKDSIYGANIYQDSIAVMHLGKPDNPHPLSVIFVKKAGDPVLDYRVIHTLQMGKAAFTGLLISTQNGVLMILDDIRKARLYYIID